MNCPHCQSTNEPKFSRELPMGYFCPDCMEDVDENPMETLRTVADFRTQLVRKEDADHAVNSITAILADPHKVMLNMLHGTIAWTPETLRRVLGPDPVREALEYLLNSIDDPPEANCYCHLSPPCHDCVDYGQLRDAIAGAKAALTAAEPK